MDRGTTYIIDECSHQDTRATFPCKQGAESGWQDAEHYIRLPFLGEAATAAMKPCLQTTVPKDDSGWPGAPAPICECLRQ
jgi:hypothetical protein